MADDKNEGGTMVVEAEPKREERVQEGRGKPKRQPPYHVVIWNDEEHTYEYVIELLMKLFGHSFESAFEITDTVHHQGKGVAMTTHLELAELKRDQVRGCGRDWRMAVSTGPIRATIEAAPGWG